MLHEKNYKCMKREVFIMKSCGIICELFKIIELMAKSQSGLLKVQRVMGAQDEWNGQHSH